jgi:sterol desaturase/sphingolipid hydroxylase (fatty acid hydroxylase superfamily)
MSQYFDTVTKIFAVWISVVEALYLICFTGHRYDWKAFAISLGDMLLRLALVFWFPSSVVGFLAKFIVAHRLSNIIVDSWWMILVLFVAQEFFYYVYHRGCHRIRWFWASHQVHHTPTELNLSAGLRNGAFGHLIGIGVFYFPLVWLGFSSSALDAALTLNIKYQHFLHCTWIPKLGRLEGIFNTPSAHRVHHYAPGQVDEGNFGGVLVIFDRLFGTYVPEPDGIHPRFGLGTSSPGNNPFRVEFGYWAVMGKDLLAARSPGQVFRALFGRPGERPDVETPTGLS